MSSSTVSPTEKYTKPGHRRVSFNVAPGTRPTPTKARKHQPAQPSLLSSVDRRSRVEDVEDTDEFSGYASEAFGTFARGRDKGKKPASIGGSPSLQTTTARAAAGPPTGNVTGMNAIHTNFNPALGVNPVFTHMNGPLRGYGQLPYSTIPGTPGAPGFIGSTVPGAMPYTFGTTLAAGADPASTGVNFFPAVPDATNGPMLHTYIPRNDMPMAVPGPGGIGLVYIQPQPGFGTPTQGIPIGNVPVATGGIATTTAPMMPFIGPGMTQSTFVSQAPLSGTGFGGGGIGGGRPPSVMMMPGSPMPGGFGDGMGIHPEAALGVGQTSGEVLQEQLEFAHSNNLYEPQDFKPADDDKSRFYWVRELDGNWTQRNRATIDRIGCRWYITDSGIFYAVRLPN